MDTDSSNGYDNNLIARLMNEINELKNDVNKNTEAIKQQEENVNKNTETIKQQEEYVNKNTKDITTIKNRPVQNNMIQILNVGEDDYFQLMENKLGSFDRALEYIRGCALGGIESDRKLLQRLYLEGDQPTICYTDRARGKLQYKDKSGKLKDDSKGAYLSKILADNLYNGYKTGIKHWQHIYAKNEEALGDPDIEIWRGHIYDLATERYRKKLFSGLNIPNKKDIQW